MAKKSLVEQLQDWRRNYIVTNVEFSLSPEAEQEAEETECANGSSFPEWIPVTERLPGDESELLVAWAGTDLGVVYAVFRHVDGSGQQLWQDASDCELKQPTHWMPLPAPPEMPRQSGEAAG